jgi:hypothetical protein
MKVQGVIPYAQRVEENIPNARGPKLWPRRRCSVRNSKSKKRKKSASNLISLDIMEGLTCDRSEVISAGSGGSDLGSLRRKRKERPPWGSTGKKSFLPK